MTLRAGSWKLFGSLGLAFSISYPVEAVPETPVPGDSRACRERYRHLVWSNPDGADDAVFIRAALLDPHVLVLADFVAEFGLDRVEREWSAVRDTPQGQRCSAVTARMLCNFRIGLGCEHGAAA